MAITDLKGTTWEVASGWQASAGYGKFSIECGITLPDWSGTVYGILAIGYAPNNTGTQYVSTANSIAWGETAMPHNGVTNTSTVTLEDISGADATNAKLIQWLETYGKLQVDTFQIPVDAPEGVRVLVKDTECRKDIDVIPVLQNKTITENGTYTAESGFAGFGEMIVDVPTPTPTTEKKTVTPSKSVQKVTATGADYLSEVTVNAIPDEYEIPVYFDAETDIEVM